MSSRAGALAIAFVVAVGILISLLLADRAADPIRAGSAAPGFALPLLNGDASLSLEQLSGRVVLVNFWATWCKPCEDEMPAMNRLYDRLRGQGFELVAISVDEDADGVRAFRERLGLSFPILLDPRRSAANAYQAYRFPESFLIDRDGKLASKFIGPRDWDTPAYEASIRRLLDRRPTAGG